MLWMYRACKQLTITHVFFMPCFFMLCFCVHVQLSESTTLSDPDLQSADIADCTCNKTRLHGRRHAVSAKHMQYSNWYSVCVQVHV